MHRLAQWAAHAAVPLALLTLVGCKEDSQASPPGSVPTAARGGTTGPRAPIGSPRDEDASTEEEDGGPDDTAGTGGVGGISGAGGAGGSAGDFAADPNECQNIEPSGVVGEDPSVDIVASTAMPDDFEVTRVVATWEPDCTVPMIRVQLSDGSCPLGRGHQLTFWFAADAIEDGAINPGLNSVFPEPDNRGISVRYVRPSRLDDPEGTWGTCRNANGTINFASLPETDIFSDLQVSRFFLELDACDDSGNDPIIVEGSFNVRLKRGREEACPDGM